MRDYISTKIFALTVKSQRYDSEIYFESPVKQELLTFLTKLHHGIELSTEIVIQNENLERDDKLYSLGIFSTDIDFITIKANEAEQRFFKGIWEDVLL